MQKGQRSLTKTEIRVLGKRLMSRRVITTKICRGYPCWEYVVPWRPSTKDIHRPTIRVQGKKTYVPRLAAVLWLGFLPDSRLQVNHHCDNTRCFQPRHLYVGTPKQNVRDAVSRERHVRGERCHSHRITEGQVEEIRVLRQQGVVREKISKRFGISTRAVTEITQGRTWRHVKGL